MARKLLTLILPLLLIVFVSTANAQTATTGSTQTTAETVEKLRQQAQLIKDQKQATTNIQQQIKERVQAKKEEIREIVAAKREEFKAKLQTIKDQRKKALVESIDAKHNSVNTKYTDRYAQVLNDLQTFLDKISQSSTEASILADVSIAQAAIDSAKLAVENQAAKTYAITISTEAALRSDVGTVTSQLRQDLVATHKAVVDAKQAVQKLNADRELIKKEATNSAN